MPPKNDLASPIMEPGFKDRFNEITNTEHAVGHVSGEYQCSQKNYRGSLIVGSKGVLFEGSMFFFQQRVIAIEWKDVTGLEKAENSVSISLTSGSYEFTSIADVERVWSSLMVHHHECITGSPSATQSMSPRTLRRTLTDPLPDFNDDDDAKTLENQCHIPVHLRSMSLPTSAEHLQNSISLITSQNAEKDARKEWEEVRAGSSDVFPHVVIKNRELPCNMDDLFDSFLSSTAKISIPSYMKEHGDMDLVVSSWETKDGDLHTRTIGYTHPVKNPLAPPRARAEKQQQYRRYGDCGVLVQTETYVKDVPMADCFYVIDRMLVEAKGTEHCLLTTEFDIRFVKSTMFQSIIANTTKKEFQKFLEGFVDVISCALLRGEDSQFKTLARGITDSERKRPLESPVWGTFLNYVAPGLLFLILLVQVWIMQKLQRLESVMHSLESKLIQSCSVESMEAST